jgi:hypothetical protein
MFIIVDVQTIFHSGIVGMLTIGLRNKHHMLGSNCSLVIAIKPGAKEYFRKATLLFLH